MPKTSATRDPSRKQFRKDLSVVIWVFFILGLVFGLPFAIVTLTSNEERPPPVATPTETIASCAGAKPNSPLRNEGPFSGPENVDADHIFVATVKTYCGNMVFKIDAQNAPDAVRSFVFLAQNRFYDGLAFDRIVPNLGLFAAAEDDPGYSLKKAGPGAMAKGDIVMVESDGRIAAHFALITGPTTSVAGVKIGSVLDNDPTSLKVLERLTAQPVSAHVPTPPIYIVHIEIQEFTRE